MRTARGPRPAVEDAGERGSCGFLSDLRVFWRFLLGRKLPTAVPRLHLFTRWTPIPESERAREREEAFFPFDGLEPGTCFSKNVDRQGPGYLFNSVIFIPLLQKACYMFRNKSVWFAKSRLSCDPLK